MILRHSKSFQKISKENICGGAILVYNRYSGQPVYYFTKRRTPPPVFSGNIFENGWLLTAALKSPSERFYENILRGVVLVYHCYSEQSVCHLTKRRTLPTLLSGETFKTGWHSPSGRFPRKHFWWNDFSMVATLNSQTVIYPKEGLYHQQIFKSGWLLTFSYATRNVDCIPLIKIKHNFFKNTFFPSAIIEWNKLDPAIWNTGSLGIFKSNILKFFRSTPTSFFNSYNHKEIRLITRLRLGLNRLRDHKFNHNFQNFINPLCSCSMDIESMSHCFLHYPLFDDKRSLS